MYAESGEEKRGFPLRDFLIKLLLVIIFVVLLVLFLPIPKMAGVIDKVFNANVQNVKDASLSYFTTERLPKKVGDSINLTLQEMIDLHLILPFTDKDGKACNMEESYVSLKKLETEYDMKVNLKCNDEEKYVITKMGCYDYCDGSICEVKECPECPTCQECPTCPECPTTPTEPSVPSVPSNPNLPYKPGDTPPPEPSKPSEPSKPLKPTEPSKPVEDYGPSCVLRITGGQTGNNGWYVSDVTVAFKSKTASKNATITGYGVGLSENYNGNNSYTLSKNGSTKVYGYVIDSRGRTAVCSIVVKKDTEKPSCSMAVLNGIKNANGVFTSDVTVGMVNNSDKISGIYTFGVGTSSSPTYNGLLNHRITRNGVYTIYGYVKDKAGNKSSCSITIEKGEDGGGTIGSKPSCVLEVKSGTLGNNGWYISNVNVGFRSKTTTNGAYITGYGIGTSTNYNGLSGYTLIADGIHTVYGYIKDSNGNTAKCSIVVKKDNTKPKCNLNVIGGTYNSNGYYTSNITIGWGSKTDALSGISMYGIGKTLTYAMNTSFAITTNGVHTIYGYVQDNAGNTSTCSITVEKQTNTSQPSCVLEVKWGTLGENGWYISNVNTGFRSKATTNGAYITSYGMGISSNANYNTNDNYMITPDGVHTVYGYVKDSNGNVAKCSIVVKKDSTPPECDLVHLSGTYNSAGYFTTNFTMGWRYKTATSGISAYGLGTSATPSYNWSNSLLFSTNGVYYVYGYLKSNSGLTNTCCVRVERRAP